MKEKIYFDDDGKAYVLDEVGNHRPPMQLPSSVMIKDSRPNGWDTYPTDQGHCALCGRLVCFGCIQGGS